MTEIEKCEHEVHLHINDNSSESIDYLFEFNDPRISITQNSKNIGGARNVNKVFQFNQDYDYTWILGDDDYLSNGSLRRLSTLINNFSPEFIFCNTLSYDGSLEAKVIDYFIKTGEFPVAGGVAHCSIVNNQPISIPFAELIHPAIDDVLLGAIMCGVFKSSAVKDYSSHLFSDEKIEPDMFSAYPHAINYTYSLPPSSNSILDPWCYTFNFWHKGNTWKDQYNEVVCLGLLFLTKCHTEAQNLDLNKQKLLMEHYIKLAKPLFPELRKSVDPGLRLRLNGISPYLVEKAFELGLNF